MPERPTGSELFRTENRKAYNETLTPLTNETETVEGLIRGTLTDDTDFKISRLSNEYQEDATEIAETFQGELAALIHPRARNVELNKSQIQYLRAVIEKSYDFAVQPDGSVAANVDRESILVIATYINSLKD